MIRFLVVAALAVVLGWPFLKQAWYAFEEPRAWERVRDSRSLFEWQVAYLDVIPPERRRPEAAARLVEVQVENHAANRDLPALLAMRPALPPSPARDRLERGLDRVLSELDPERHPERVSPSFDPDLARAVRQLAGEEVRAGDAAVDLAISITPELPPQAPGSPDDVVPLEPALTPAVLARPRAVQLFTDRMVEAGVRPFALEPGPPRPGHPRLSIEARLRRASGLVDCAGRLLFQLELDATVSLSARNGQRLHAFHHTGLPAPSRHFRLRPGDPPWAGYVLMLDSCLDDLAQQLLLRLGLKARSQPGTYRFEG